MSEADSDLLSAYIDQQLSASERASLEQRLEQEPELRLALEELRATVEVLRALPPVTPPRSFTLPATTRAPGPWLSLGMLRFGSTFASVLLMLTFLPALLRAGGELAQSGGAARMGAAPTAPAAYEAAVFPTAAAAATAGLAMQPQAAPEASPNPAAGIVGAEPTAAAPAVADSAPTENAQARILEETSVAQVPQTLQGLPSDPASGSSSDTGSAAGGNTVSPPIATSGSSSPGTAALEPPAVAPEPVELAPAEPPISLLNLLRLGLAAVAVGCAVAFWRRRQQEQW